MRNARIGALCYLVATTILVVAVLPLHGGAEGDDKMRLQKCDIYDLDRVHCGKNQMCRLTQYGQQATCECLRGFHVVNNECVKIAPRAADVDANTLKPDVKSESGGSSVAAGLLIPTFLVVVGVLLYFGARRYKWLQRFRQYRHNRYGNVLVTRDDDDDDDPPIA